MTDDEKIFSKGLETFQFSIIEVALLNPDSLGVQRKLQAIAEPVRITATFTNNEIINDFNLTRYTPSFHLFCFRSCTAHVITVLDQSSS